MNYEYVVRCHHDEHFPIDNIRYNTHNYFQTETEAQKYADVLNTEIELRKYADEHNSEFNNGYRILYCFISEESYEFIPRCIKFSSVDVIDDAIEEIGKDKVIEYLTYEW